jgi:hypothetical protein
VAVVSLGKCEIKGKQYKVRGFVGNHKPEPSKASENRNEEIGGNVSDRPFKNL